VASVRDILPGSRQVVLVVDDDPSIRRLCHLLLRREGWEVAEAANGREAVDTALGTPPDVIIMDVMMPVMDGLEATRALRAHPSTEHLPIIMLSALDDETAVVAALEAGADEYLGKPVRPREFLTRIRSMTRLRRAWREQQRSYSILGEQARALNLLLDFSMALSRTEALDQILGRTAEVTATLTAARRVFIQLADPAAGILRIAHHTGLDPARSSLTVPFEAPATGRVFSSQEQLVLNSREALARLGDAPDAPLFDLFPVVSTPMCAAEHTLGVLNVCDRFGSRAFTEQELEYLRLIGNYSATAIQNVYSSQARDEARDSIVVALAHLAEHRDDGTGRHLDRVTRFCLRLAEELRREPSQADRITDGFLRSLERAAPLHDIGKVAIPDAILLKPGKLTAEEMEVMRTHTTVGTETIRSLLARLPGSEFLLMAEEIAHAHHEWFNGTGYPRGLAGEDIPLPARIAALADVYDALTTRRPYKEAMPHAQAVQIIVGHSGRQFDPQVVSAFLRCAEDFERLARTLADDTARPSHAMLSLTARPLHASAPA
jgi:response regulator RpfG family c-di-GMP phosphodiesterase